MKKIEIKQINVPRLLAVLYGLSPLLSGLELHIANGSGFVAVRSDLAESLKSSFEQNGKCERACVVVSISDHDSN